MRHATRDASRSTHLGEDVGMLEPEHIAVAGAAMLSRGHAGVDRGIARGRDGRQNRAQLPDPRIAAVHPAFQVAKEPAKVAVGDPIQNDQQQLVVHGGISLCA